MAHPDDLPNSVDSFLAAANLSTDLRDGFDIYAQLLVKWQRHINLVANNTLPYCWRRHFLDSAQILRFLPPHPLTSSGPFTIVDMGTGAGFPGMVLALARPDIQVHLIDSDTRKMAFLREVAGRTKIRNVMFHVKRLEVLEPMSADILVSRACAPLGRLLNYGLPFITPDTVALFLKGAKAAEELTEARKAWMMTVDSFPSMTDPAGLLLRITDIARV